MNSPSQAQAKTNLASITGVDPSDPIQRQVLESIGVDWDIREGLEELVTSAYVRETDRPHNISEAMKWFSERVDDTSPPTPRF